jgi:hypothetical protein
MSRQNLRGTGQPHQITDPGTRLDRPFLGGQSYRQVPDTTRALLDDPAEEWDGADATLLPITRSANRRAFQSPLDGADLAALLRKPPPWCTGWRFTVPGADSNVIM